MHPVVTAWNKLVKLQSEYLLWYDAMNMYCKREHDLLEFLSDLGVDLSETVEF